ncbi:MAG: nicotinate-nucleotide adenylyltransferase [Desulfobulbaceae bacterium]|nr:nicotinate-nucleotide adenylyltransferase [Desulfobulbaceae bacterium]
MADKKRKIGMFGGTFDPVHKGHLAVAHGALDRYCLDEIIFIPAARPPHKRQPMTGFRHRAAMLEAALAGEAKFSISLIEAERSAPSYTLDTLVEIRERVGNHHYHLLIGADSFVEVHLWYRYRDIFRLADFVVAARPGIDREEVARQVRRLPGSFRYDSDKEMWTREDDDFHIFYFSAVHMDLSSSEIRGRLLGNREVKDVLPARVAEYIRTHRLYVKTG